MNILVTGGSGFIGSAVIRHAIAQGHQVLNVDCLTYAACQENLRSVFSSPNYTFENVDVRDFGNLEALFERHLPDCIMHLAAETHVDRSIDGPETFITTNVLGTYNVLEVSRKYWEKRRRPKNFRFLHISTDEVFGSLSFNPTELFSETSPYMPSSPYSASKAGADHLVRAWHQTYDFPTILTNCSNNYGPFQFPEKLIPVIILKALKGLPIPIYGDGRNVRDWLYVDDHAEGLLMVLERAQIGARYNLGGNSELANLDVVENICKIMDGLRPKDSGSYSELITFVKDRPGHDARYAIDASLIKRELGWAPRTSIEQGLKNTITWYLENEDWWGPLLGKS